MPKTSGLRPSDKALRVIRPGLLISAMARADGWLMVRYKLARLHRNSTPWDMPEKEWDALPLWQDKESKRG